MKKLQELFGRASLIRPPAQALRLIAQRSIKEIVGSEIRLADLTVRAGTLFVRASPVVKSQVFLKKEEILNSIKKTLGPQASSLNEVR